MKRLFGLVAAGLMGLGFLPSANAQVDGVNFTLSPNVSYNWWNQNIALKNSPFYGLRLGVGFGPYVELRGTFEKSVNLKNTIKDKNWNFLNEDALNKLDGMEFDITRLGGELKFNILSSNYSIAPYLTVGGGVQMLDYNPFDTKTGVVEDAKETEKQIYLSAGAGVRFNLSERIALSLEGRNTQFNLDKVDYLLNPNVNDKAKRWGNWSAIASLDITLGGMSGYSDASRQYSNLFEDGFRGVKFVLEPGIMYADFHDKLNRADQFFIGGSAGLDFSSLIGLRAFYYQATEQPDKPSFKFNKDLKMYGANLLFRLNQPRGIVPYLTLGAGYLDDKSLIPTDPNAPSAGLAPEERFDVHNLFLMGGAGLEIPFSKYVALFGNVNALLSNNEASKLKNVEVNNIYTSLMYNAGVRINLGRSAYEPMININGNEESLNDRVNDTRSEAQKQSGRHTIFQRERVRGGEMMTKQQFEEMVDRILYKIRSEESARVAKFSDSEMDIIVAALNSQNPQGAQVVATNDPVANQQLVNEMRRLVDRMDRLEGKTTAQTNVVPVQRVDPLVTTPTTVVNGATTTTTATTTHAKNNFLKLNRLAVLTGANFGEGTQWMVGMRGYMQISDTDLDFVPELMAGFGKKGAFDLSANVIYNFKINNSVVDPYAGLGLGVYSHGLGLKFGPNFIAGANFKLNKSGELFADYTARGLFKNNQIAVGYRFVF
ncbi:MAG: outer membrane beta-barrel protein [Porphyromonas somerae]|uniref:outer membrane beta-barrel protein n=1 Tax=Porphyromonas somerae TaxID=322095 RepID=UPI0026F2FED4|nr:outer membrane beta-barrel protein [Porphyromonas somerae]MDD7557649.1 outer membrane beta-barrel protein [Porphyromonas somerae]MDY3884570.1 outer membrane beta-barrel protein [Porphyromonas somerae]MDY5814708.1 outer membrane beta-barrel protein [Porphyromonas somerae]